MSDDAVVVVPPGAGEVVPRPTGERTVVKAAEAETGGAYAIRENSAPAGYNAVPFHLHREAEEAFFILEGEMTVFTRAARWRRRPARSCWSRAAPCTRSPTGARCRCAGSR